MKPILLALCAILSLYNGMSQQVAKSLTTSKDLLIGFYQYTPTDYLSNPAKKYPLIIFLHGLGERGNGTTELNRVTTHGIPKNIKNGHPMRFFWNGKWETFIVISPQLSASYSVWQTFYVDEILDYAKKNLRIDTNRIALTGMSLGGGGVWSFSSRYAANPYKLSSVVSVCGTYKVADMSGIAQANLPVWAFHASNDGSVSVSNTHTAISRIMDWSPNVEPYKTIWPSGNHGIWDRAYDTEHSWQNPNIYEWMIAQDKSLPVNKRPTTNAGTDISVSSGTEVTISGALSKDEDGSIVRYIWRKISGPSTGTLSTPVSTDGVTQITGMSAGNYQYELKAVDDRADYTLDTISIEVVNYSTPNIPPVVKAGEDRFIYDTRSPLTGSDSYDPDGVIVSYKWSLEEGPGQYTILNENAGNTEVINLGTGTYKFKLTATDNKGASRTGIVTITEMSSVLGVDFGKISVKSKSASNIISWTTTSEYKNEYFDIERSLDGIKFVAIGRLIGKDSSSVVSNYTFEDRNPYASVTHYRIKQVSYGSKVKYSAIVKSVGSAPGMNVSVYPVPAGNSVTIKIEGLNADKGVLYVRNMNGKLHYQEQIEQIQHGKTIHINTSRLSAGMYFITLQLNDGKTMLKQFIKQ